MSYTTDTSPSLSNAYHALQDAKNALMWAEEHMFGAFDPSATNDMMDEVADLGDRISVLMKVVLMRVVRNAL